MCSVISLQIYLRSVDSSFSSNMFRLTAGLTGDPSPLLTPPFPSNGKPLILNEPRDRVEPFYSRLGTTGKFQGAQ